MSTTSARPTESHGTDMPVRAVAAATIGTALEWFDFSLYGVVAATIFPQLFFPSLEPSSALLASLATFGVGLAARPLGAVLCGYAETVSTQRTPYSCWPPNRQIARDHRTGRRHSIAPT